MRKQAARVHNKVEDISNFSTFSCYDFLYCVSKATTTQCGKTKSKEENVEKRKTKKLIVVKWKLYCKDFFVLSYFIWIFNCFVVRGKWFWISHASVYQNLRGWFVVRRIRIWIPLDFFPFLSGHSLLSPINTQE